MMKVKRLCCCAVIGLSTLGVTYANDLSSPVTLTKSQLNQITEKYKLWTVTDINAIGCVGAYIGNDNLWRFVNKCSNVTVGFTATLRSNMYGDAYPSGGLRPYQELIYRNHPYPTWGLIYLNDWRY
jgi:hypothetical protein